MTRIGDRVIAIRNADKDKVYSFGPGIYEKDEDYTGPGPFGVMTYPCNPKILLDNGKVVHGCQCWFGSMEKVTLAIGMREVVEVDIDAHLEKCMKENAEAEKENAEEGYK